MGAAVQCENYLSVSYSMRDEKEDSSSSSWSRFYGDKSAPVLQYNNGTLQRTPDGYPEHERDALKQKMLQHEAVFKNQIQRNMMDAAKNKDFFSLQPAMEQSSSSCPQGPQLPSDVAKWNAAAFPLWGKQSAPSAEIFNPAVSLHNGSNLKEEAVALNGRPSKARKTFDLQLPPDDCLDIEGEEDLKQNSGHENVTKKFLVDHLGSSRDASKSSLCFRGSATFVDLNEPIRNEGTSSPSIHFLDFSSEKNTESRSLIQQAKPKAAGFGASGETSHLSNGFFINSSVDGKVHNRSQLSHTYESGFPRSVVGSLPQSNQLDVSPFFSNIHHGTPSYSYGKEEDRWLQRLRHGFESSNGNHDRPGSFNGCISREVSHNTSTLPFLSSVLSAPPPTMLSWANPNSSFGRPKSVNPVSEPLLQTPDQFSRKMFTNSSSRPSPAMQSESTSNGFYHGSASGSKERSIKIQPPGFNFSPYSRFNNVGTNCLNPSCRQEGKSPALAIDLNEEVARSPSDEVVILEDMNVAVGKFEPVEPSPALPWLKPKPFRVNEAASPCNVWGKNEANGIFNQKLTVSATDSKVGQDNETVEIKPVKRIMGFPILDRHGHENELPEAASTSSSIEGKSASCVRKSRMIDINVACDPDEINAEEQPIREYIDLNASAGYCEAPLCQDDERNGSGSRRKMLEIDLEAPYIHECEEDDTLLKGREQIDLSMGNDDLQEEALRAAAELMLEMSSLLPTPCDGAARPSEVSLAESLVVFVDAVDALETSDRNRDSKEPRSHVTEEIDEFEAMTLQLEDTTEEHYMLKLTALQLQNVEEAAASGSAGRPRRGQARRGRPRRDFQRDILPGLTSLSRQEMTEDLQIFGSVMRVMGHCWSPGLTRRNGGRNTRGRGRKRAAIETAAPSTNIPSFTPASQQPSSEDRSLTCWGKTTRRPRRQRCSQGNPSPAT